MRGNYSRRTLLLGMFLATLFLFPLLYDNAYMLSVLVLANIYTVYVAAWDMVSGFTGQENFGFALFIGSGAYFVGLMTQFICTVSPWWGIPVGGLIAAVIGFIIGVPCLRLKGPYLALATMAAATIADRVVIIFSKYTGGEDGIYGIEFLTNSPVADYYTSLIFMIASVGILYYIGQSYIGLLLKAIRQDENSAQASGVNTTFYKVAAFIVSAFFGGMAGAFNGHYLGYIGPDAVLASNLSLNIIIMAIVGGTGTIINAAFGAFVLAIVGEYLKMFGEYHLLIYTTLLIGVLLYMPKGVFTTLFEHFSPSGNGLVRKGGSSHEHSGS